MLQSILGAAPISGGAEIVGEASLSGYIYLLLFAFVAIGFSFFCSIAEAVLLSVTPTYVATLGDRRQSTARLLESFKSSIDRPLAAILSLNTIAHTVGAAGVGAQAAAIWGSRWVGLVSAVMTLLILVFSEIIPKTIGAIYWRPLAPSVARAVQLLIIAMLPLVWLSDLLTKMIGGESAHEVVTREEVAAMATLGAEGGQLDSSEIRILHNLLRFESLRVADVMTPRTVMIAYPAATTIGELFALNPELPVSRIPIYGDSIDDIIGIVLANDLWLARAEGRFDTRLEELRRDATTIPWNAPLKRLFDQLLTTRQHIAIVVDEYGGTDGLVTLEDLIETLLGMEIVDESDAATDMQKLARRQWEKRARAMKLHVESAVEPNPPEAQERGADPTSTLDSDDSAR